MKTLLTLSMAISLVACTCAGLRAQTIATDSKANSVFGYYSKPKVRADINGKEFSVTFNLWTYKLIAYRDSVERANLDQAVRERIKIDTTVTKNGHFFLTTAVLNADKLITLSDIENFHPGGKLTFGYQISLDSINANYHGPTYGFGINAMVMVDNFMFYDQLSGKSGRQNPFGSGLEANLTFFPWAFKGNNRPLLVALSASYTYGSNKDALLNYKMRSDAIVGSDVVAFKQYDGKYGTLVTDVHTFRGSIAFPISLGHYNPIPYIAASSSKVNGEAYFYGIYNNLVYKKISFHHFTAPTSLGIGLDYMRSKGEWSKLNVFVRGSISFGKVD